MTAAITGLGSALPGRVVTNHDLTRELDTSDEWIRNRTGIRQRHVIDPGLSTSDLAVASGRQALVSADRESVDLVVVATTTPDRLCPAMAPGVATALGMEGVPAFDLSAVCSGFLYGLAMADSMIRSGAADSVLVIGAEVFSSLLDPRDRTTRVIFGDGAGAAVVESAPPGADGEIVAIRLGSDGGRSEDIVVAGGGVRERLSGAAVDPYFRMDGKAVFLRAVLRMEESSEAVLGEAGWLPEDLALIVSHQANARIIRALADRFGIDHERAYLNIQDVGNTAAASVPLAMSAAQSSRAVRPGERVLLSAYGGGATWGAAAVRWPRPRNTLTSPERI